MLCPCIAAVTYIHNILVIRRYYVLVEVTRKENKYTLMPFVYPKIASFLVTKAYTHCMHKISMVSG